MAQKLYQTVVTQALLVSRINLLLVLVLFKGFLDNAGKRGKKRRRKASFILKIILYSLGQTRPNVTTRFENDPCWRRNNDILFKHWEPSGLRVCDKGKMETQTINTSVCMKQEALNTPLSAPPGKEQHINQKPITHTHSTLHTHTNPEATCKLSPEIYGNFFPPPNINCVIIIT